jgi:hypothetical protein
VQVGRQFVAARYRQLRQFPYQVPHHQLVAWIPDAKIAGHGKGRHVGCVIQDRPANLLQIQRCLLLTVHAMASLQKNHRILAHHLTQAGLIQ